LEKCYLKIIFKKSINITISPNVIKGKYFVVKNRLVPVSAGENPQLDICTRTTQKAGSNLFLQKHYGGRVYISSLYPKGKPTNPEAQQRANNKDNYNHQLKDYTQWTFDYAGTYYLLTITNKTATIKDLTQ